MKTAMQKHIEKLDLLISRNTNIYAQAALKDVKFEIENELLEAEKEQIIEASVQANLRYDTWANEPVVLKYRKDAEQYYQETFNPER